MLRDKAGVQVDSEFRRLIEQAYTVAIEPALLEEWTAAAGRWIGGRTTAVSVVDREAQALVLQHIAHPEPEQLEDYVSEGLHLIDPQLPIVASLNAPRLYRSAEVVDRTQPDTRRYMAFVNDRAGIDQCATAAMLLGDGRHVATLTTHNPLTSGAVDDDQWRRLRALAPTLGRALALGTVHGRKLSAAWWDGRLAAATEPTALLDECGRILRATPDMVEWLRRSDGIREVNGRLAALDPASNTNLGAVLASAIVSRGSGHRGDDGPPIAAAVRIVRPTGQPPLIMTLWPLVPVVRHLLPEPAAVLVTLVDPASAPPPRTRLWRESFGLTARETEVAALLADGHSPESAAAVLGVTLSTLRVHLRRLMTKTDTNRQTDLLRLLGRIG